MEPINGIDRSYWLSLQPEDWSYDPVVVVWIDRIDPDGINRSVGFGCRLLLPIDFEKLHNSGMNPAVSIGRTDRWIELKVHNDGRGPSCRCGMATVAIDSGFNPDWESML